MESIALLLLLLTLVRPRLPTSRAGRLIFSVLPFFPSLDAPIPLLPSPLPPSVHLTPPR